MSLDNTQEAFDAFGDRVIFVAKRNLAIRKANASGDLSNSLGGKVKVSKNSIQIDFTANAYGEFVDGGRGTTSGGGDGSVRKSIEEWIRTKRIRLRDAKTGAFQKMTEANIKGAAFVIARKIHEKGYKGNNFLTDAINDGIGKLENDVAEKYGLDLATFLDNFFNGTNNTDTTN